MYGWGLDERVHRQCEAVGHVAAQEVAHAEVEAHVEVVVIDIFNDEVWSWWNTFTRVANALLICHTQTRHRHRQAMGLKWVGAYGKSGNEGF